MSRWIRASRVQGTVIDAARYGIRGDGTVDDTAALQAALDAASSAAPATVKIPKPQTAYLITRLVIRSAGISIVTDPMTLFRRAAPGRAGEAMLEVLGTSTDVATTLSAGAHAGSLEVQVADGSGLSAGDWIEISSSAAIKGQSPYVFEMQPVTAVAGRTITLGPLRNAYDPQSAGVMVRKVRLLNGVSIAGGIWEGPGGEDGDCLRIAYAMGPMLSHLTVRNFGNFGIVLYRCKTGTVDTCLAYGGTNRRRSWAISLLSCEGVHAEACSVRDTPWDAFNLSYGAMHNHLHACRATDVGDVGFVVGHGVHGHHNILSECVALRAQAAGFGIGDPSYEGDDENVFHLCQALMCHGGGFQVRRNSRGNHFQGCRALNNGGSGFAIEPGAKDTVIAVSEAGMNAVHGVSLMSQGMVAGGTFHDNGGNGIRISGAARSTVVGVVAAGNQGHDVALTDHADDTVVMAPVVRNAGRGSDGVYVGDSKNVLLWGVQALANEGFGVEVYETAPGAAMFTRTKRLTSKGNQGGPIRTNNVVARTLPANETSPSVAVGDTFVTSNTRATVINDFRDGTDGRAIYVRLDAHTTVRNSSAVQLIQSDYVGPSRGWLVLWRINGAWHEIDRDVE